MTRDASCDKLYVARVEVGPCHNEELVGAHERAYVNVVISTGVPTEIEERMKPIVESLGLEMLAIDEIQQIQQDDLDSLERGLRDAFFEARETGETSLSTFHVFPAAE